MIVFLDIRVFKLKINFICTSGKSNFLDAGIGHLKRSLILANELSSDDNKINFFVFGGDSPPPKISEKINLEILKVKHHGSFLDDKDLSIEPPCSDISFLDMSNPFFIKHSKKLIALIEKIKNNSKLTVIIDGLGTESIINNIPKKIPYDFLIAPYFGAEQEFEDIDQHLLGSEFFITEFNQAGYQHHKNIPKKAKKICITCGGSDPKKITLQILRSINKIIDLPELKVIIGPNFSEDHVKEIEDTLSTFSSVFTLVVAPSCIQNYIEWSDIVIATSGLTKYEILKSGVPSIIIPFDESQFKTNKASAKKNAFLTISAEKIKYDLGPMLKTLISDNLRRKDLSDRAFSLLDDRGVSRIISRIKK